MKKVLKQIAILFGFNRDTKYVRDYLNDQNTKSGIYMGGIIAMIEVWLLFRQSHQYAQRYPVFALDTYYKYISIYVLFLLAGLSLALFCITKNVKMKSNAKLVLNLVGSGLLVLAGLYVFDKGNYAAWDGSLNNNVLNIFLIMLYAAAIVDGLLVIANSLLIKFKGKDSSYLTGAIIIMFALLCLTFGVRVSYSDHTRFIAGAGAKTPPNEIICFLMMGLYVACLLIWRPWISVVINSFVFIGFYFLINGWDQATIANQYAMEYKGATYYVESFTEGDLINYITFLISLTTICVMIYHQRRSVAIKDETLEYNANFDSLTGLHTTGYYVREVNAFTSESKNEEIQKKIVLFININDFKLFNDQRGFLAGNEFLKDVGHLIEEAFPNSITCRQADDHYFVYTDIEGLMPRIEELAQKVKALDDEIRPDIKVGGYRPTQPEEARRMIDKARYACSVINNSRTELYMEYDQKMHDGYHLMQYVIHNVDKACENGWLQPYYQPVVYSESGELCGCEALVRWIDPEHGFLSPGMFVPTLESVKLIHKVDAYLVERVCQDLRRTMDAGLPVVPVSINFSRHDFECMDAIGHLEEVVKKYNIPKEMLHVEITESAMMDNVEILLDASHKLKKAGYALWLDDFGSGYSSLNVLKDFDFDVMKIDMVFLKNFEKNEKAKPLIESIVQMANKMGMRTLTEGVETDEQRAFLKTVKCERLQGYLFGKPISYDDFINKVKNNDFKVSKNLI